MEITHVVMEVGIRDGDPVSSMRQIDQAIVEVLVITSNSREITVVNPDIGRLLNGNRVTVVSFNLGDLHVADNDVLLSVDGQTNAGKGFTELSVQHICENRICLQLPVFPIMDLFEVT